MEFPLGGRYTTLIKKNTQELIGLVDMHTHPMSHLGFGTELFYGKPDGKIEEALHNCNQFHGGFGLFDNPHANEFRHMVVDKLQANQGVEGWDHKRQGFPEFRAWPSWHDRLHQQMWVDWLRRAWQGGLRTIVALAVNNHCLADMAETQGPYDDLTVMNNQILETVFFVSRHSDFMAIAKSSAELKQIVKSGRLAVILGVETDHIGNFYQPANIHHSGAGFTPNPTFEQVKSEINRLYEMGVRYIFPVHVTNNIFSGTAVYERAFAAATRYSMGSHLSVESAPAESEINYTHNYRDGGLLDRILLSIGAVATLGFDPTAGHPAIPPTSTGHRNALGLTELGLHAIAHMMTIGMMIDVDHMSEKSVETTLELAKTFQYPINSGHSGVRAPGGTERHHTAKQLRAMLDLGGLWGIGMAGGLEQLAKGINDGSAILGNISIAIGSDANGLDHLPKPRFAGVTNNNAGQRSARGMVVYRDNVAAPGNSLIRCSTARRTWDYSQEGMMHYGLLPDMLEEMVSSQLIDTTQLNQLFRSAQSFYKMWERCEAASARLKRVTKEP